MSNEQEKWDRTKLWQEQLQSEGKILRTIQGIDLTPSESATDLSWGEHHDEGWCDLAPEYYLKFLLSPANLSLINNVREQGEIRAHMSDLEAVPEAPTHDFCSTEILFPLTTFEVVVSLGALVCLRECLFLAVRWEIDLTWKDNCHLTQIETFT